MNCKNCDTVLKEQDDFCNSCGAKVIRNRLTVRNLFEHFSETFFNYDNKFLQTFIHLFSKPEAVIGCYIDGTRKKYVNVISYFAISLTVFGLQLFVMNTFFKDAFDLSSFNKSISSGFDSPEGFIQSQEQFQKTLSNYQSLIYILTTPLTAFITWLVFYITKKRNYNYTEHIVINLYYSAQVIIVTTFSTILLMCFGLNFYTISFIFTFLSFVYLAFIFKKLYGLKIQETIVNVLFFVLLYGLLFVLIMVITIIIAIIMVKIFGIEFNFAT